MKLSDRGVCVIYERAISCCFTGHRPTKLPWGLSESDVRCSSLKFELSARLEGIYEAGYRHFICGMALGCDMYFAEAVLILKQTHIGVTLEAVVPCADQAKSWTGAQRLRYEELLSLCDKRTVLQEHYSPGCMMRRNKHMVDSASLLLACYNGKSGGTMNTILYAQRSRIKTLIIDI